jgi:hypothetical protein
MGALELHKDELYELIVFFARGYSIRYIRAWLTRRAAELGRPSLVPSEQQLLRLAVDYAPNIEEVREELAQDTLTRGLARKEERVRRLSEMAESIEGQAQSGANLKASEMYRRALRDIKDEMEPIAIPIILPDDKWAQLLSGLREKRELPESQRPLLGMLESDQEEEKSTP